MRAAKSLKSEEAKKKGNTLSNWTYVVAVDFAPLPPEKEEAYWAAIEYFAEVMLKVIEEEIIIEARLAQQKRSV